MRDNTSASTEALAIGDPLSRKFPAKKRKSARRIQAGLTEFALADFLTIFLTGIAAKYLYLDFYLDSAQPDLKYVVIALFLAFTLNLFHEQMGLYKAEYVTGPLIGFGKLWGGLLLSFLVLIGCLYMLKISDVFSRGWIFSWFLLSAPALVFMRWQVARLIRRRINEGRLQHSVAIYGSPAFLSKFKGECNRTGPLGTIRGIYVTPDRGSGHIDANGYLSDLRVAMSQGQYDTVIVALPTEEKDAIQLAVKSLASYSTELLLCSDLNQYPCSVSGSRMHGNLRFDVINVVPSSEYSQVAKPMLDYVLALAGVIALAPIFLLIALAVKLDSQGPVFFRQRRYGKNNKIFRIFKFRTMTVAEDGPVVVQAKKNDARVTRVGGFLRRTSLDEIPQLFNVLLGDMSIVGPRPHAIAHDEAFEEKLDLFSRRRRVRPGITGWAQVNGFRGETKTIEDVRDRMQHDLYYIDNWSIWLDMEIIARTIMVAASKRAY